jgi:outer membrane protein OmpA-like peptidoglycan-associated protein
MLNKTLIIFFFAVLSLNAQEILKQKNDLSAENTTKLIDYIKKYAPSDSALAVVHYIANFHSQRNSYAKAQHTYRMFKPLFTRYADKFDKRMKEFEELMLYQGLYGDLEYHFKVYIQDNAPSDNAFLAVQKLAEKYIRNKQWDSATTIFRSYSQLFPNKKRQFENLISVLEAPEEGLEVTNLGPPINTRLSEWDPNPTPDGKYFYFSSQLRSGGFGQDDVWMSEIVDGKWTEPVNLGWNINSMNDETIDNVTADGNNLLLSGEFTKTFGKFDIYISTREKDGWGEPVHFPAPINTKYSDEGGNLTADGQALLFSSDRPGGIGPFVEYNSQAYHGSRHGNMDIYVSMKTDTGWSEPINLGETINTPYAERAPYLHPDGKTLYFSSDGHPGLGRLDVFKTVRLNEDSWTEWSEPVNLGKEINTVNDDWGYVISLDGDYAYFAGLNRPGGRGGWDLYYVMLPLSGKPGEVVTIEGFLTDNEGNPVEATIRWEDLETGELAGEIKSNPKDGSYFLVLHYGKNYGYFVDKEGYFPASNNVDLRINTGGESKREDIKLIRIQDFLAGKERATLNNVFFDFDKAELKHQSKYELKRIINILNRLPNGEVLIEGHTDNLGNMNYNMELSKKRVQSVIEFLKKNGLKQEIELIGQGMGDLQPIAENTSEKGRALNRRVEISVVK